MSEYNNINKRQKEITEKLEKQIEFERPYNLIKYQHKLAQTLLKEQHELNLEIHKKQTKLIKFTTYIMAVVTIVAVLLGTVLGWYLANLKLSRLAQKERMDKELQIKDNQKPTFEESQVHHKEEAE